MSAMCLVHQRFSTNTFPTWQLAHPFRYVAHNGEINTVTATSTGCMRVRSVLDPPLFGDDIKKLFPIIQPSGSDSAAFDNALELLVLGGRSLPHAMAMLIPEAWDGNPNMNAAERAFYEYHCSLMEPWDGPAAIAFTDGRVIGATLDRNGLRPARYLVTNDDLIVLASETGVLSVKPEDVKMKGRLQPGKMLLVDLEQGASFPITNSSKAWRPGSLMASGSPKSRSRSTTCRAVACAWLRSCHYRPPAASFRLYR